MTWQKIDLKDVATTETQQTPPDASDASEEDDGVDAEASAPEPSPARRPRASSNRVHLRSGRLDLPHLREERDVDWTLPWSDLMMTLFVLFLTLYLYEAQTSTAQEVIREPSLPDLRELPSKSQFASPDDDTVTHINRGWGEAGYLQIVRDDEGQRSNDSKELEDLEELRLDDINDMSSIDLVRKRAYRIVLTGDLLFDRGQAEIRPEALPVLRKAAEIVGSTPYMVNVVGHTDATPIHSNDYPSNWELSLARAAVIARYLIDRLDVPASQFYVTGHADNRPIAGNATAQQRARNRRVDIVVTREIPSSGV